eukprot:GGOE01049648.1.p1 GENE.GGOE01049648.1~~GGOE01049648.1.p1  ORF type:complete len:381 (+),score=108.22 GGOE01049648.1:63-1145(+)
MEEDAVPLVFDAGGGSVKCGRAAEGVRPLLVPTVCGVHGDARYAGQAAWDLEEAVVSCPLMNGVVSDWEGMELLWDQCFKELNAQPFEQPLLVTQASGAPRPQQQRLAQVLFERFNVPALCLAAQPVLALYASGATTGLLLDVGESGSSAVPVVDGLCQRHAVLRMPVAGRALSLLLSRCLVQRYPKPVSPPVVQSLKEAVALVSPQPLSPADRPNPELVKECMLPDGAKVTFQAPERLALGEALFEPRLLGIDDLGVPRLALCAAQQTDHDLRRAVAAQVAVAGGCSMISGFSARLHTELELLWPEYGKFSFLIPRDRHLSAWNGGVILSSVSTAQQLWISRQDYDEVGPTMVHRRCIA